MTEKKNHIREAVTVNDPHDIYKYKGEWRESLSGQCSCWDVSKEFYRLM